MKKSQFVKQDILKLLEILGLKLDKTTGGTYCNDFTNKSIRKNRIGLYELDNGEYKISFLNGLLFLTTVKTVEKNLNYKLFS